MTPLLQQGGETMYYFNSFLLLFKGGVSRFSGRRRFLNLLLLL
jgi:hypothetical protein